MRLGILETGAPPPGVDQFGDYPAMFRALLGPQTHHYTTFDVQAGALPATAQACEAYIVTGSSAGVYDPLPWIAPLSDFLRAARGTPMVGICFGHQIMAQAFGGKVIKSPKGWGVGLHRYEVQAPQAWMDAPRLTIPASHQDQVVEPPPGATVLAGSGFTPLGMLAYDDQPAISLQLHPEFEPAYARALIEARRGTRYTDEEADRAILSFEQPDDRSRVGGWIARFLAQATLRRP
ncbi:type 1 glutamine amidotransferase [Phenylobacterium sp.]|uniref:glutamine amidotransferase-related protein n=1 Tax=Phenylobacterium sp. TaxID=1871053 RepID=UPI00271890E5|nr:type 1 glutamine amidotransferase [Phenylobacterium sp.]MDO8380927.1 type 1 glutamine amidotransferase [Phenylobacterium sp.]